MTARGVGTGYPSGKRVSGSYPNCKQCRLVVDNAFQSCHKVLSEGQEWIAELLETIL